ncbi:hypothetical protein [Sphingomonas sp.]|uniref:hypothetical protein n=1 Tax=Sphingomonas sp. TaxID=28214 RepID=UPI003D6CA138
MKIITAISAMALTLVGMRPADATTYTPAGTFVLQGTGLCTLTVTITVPDAAPDVHGSASHGHSATAVPVLGPPSSSLCASATFVGAPYAVSYNGGNLSITGVTLNTVAGNCSGDIGGIWDDIAKTLTVTQSLGGGAIVCNVRATLNLISGAISIIP